MFRHILHIRESHAGAVKWYGRVSPGSAGATGSIILLLAHAENKYSPEKFCEERHIHAESRNQSPVAGAEITAKSFCRRVSGLRFEALVRDKPLRFGYLHHLIFNTLRPITPTG